MPGRLDFSFQFGGQPEPASRRAPEDPFRLLVVGDFGGGEAPRPQRVDLDMFDAVMARRAPRASLSFGAERVELSFTSLDDLHPDALLQRLPALQQLLQQRARLRDPRQAAALLGSIATAAPAAPSEPTASMFERLLGQRHDAREDPVAAGLDPLLARLVQPHLLPSPDPRVPDLVASLEATATGLLREVLHHPSFQSLEAAWRGLYWLLQNLELDEDLQVSMLDLEPQRLRALTAGDDLGSSPLHQLLVEAPGAAAAPWSLVVMLSAFGADAADVRTLAALATLAARGGFAVVGTAAPTLCGTDDLARDAAGWQLDAEAAARWQALRQLPAARHLGLVLPRLLLRLPYGAGTDPIEGFLFEEQPLPPASERYLWAAPGLAVARLLGQAFRQQGWQLQTIAQDVDGLPLHTWRQDGEVRVQPCAELLLGERAAAAIDAQGLMLLQSFANRDAARLLQLRSVAMPASGLAGPWA